MKTAFFIISRMDSHRLPGKAMLHLGEKPLIEVIIDQCRQFDDILPVLLTTTRPVDDCLATLGKDKNCAVFRGDLERVSLRVSSAIKEFGVDYFFRMNGDSPCLDSEIITQAYKAAQLEKPQIITNLIHRTYPYGVAVELINSQFYLEEQSKFNTPHHWEHVTSYLYENLEHYRVKEIRSKTDASHHALTIDSLDDYIFFLKLLRKDKLFFQQSLTDKIKLLEKVKR